ncbi:MAG: hypothetical protein ABIP11_05435 [Luteimonas sp.]
MRSREPVDPADANIAIETASEVIPRHTTPTWESELLLSGATVFGLLQVPASLYSLIDRLHHQLPAMWDSVLLLGSMFSLAMLYALILTFLLHLASRAYWVALVGLRSVYPQGIRWDRSKGGPIGRRLQQSLFGDQDALIERADNKSTLIFSTGIALVFNALAAILISLPPLLLAVVLQSWVWPLPDPSSWFLITIGLLIVPIVLPRLLDSVFGDRLAADGALAILLENAQRKIAVLGPWRMAEPLVLNLTTNRRGKHGFLAFLLLIYALFFATTISENMRRKGVGPSSLLSISDPSRQLGDYYENSGAPSLLLPHIASDMVTDPYLRLWVPLDSHRSQAFVRACTTHASAACLGSVFALELDGKPVSGIVWHPYRDPFLGADGLRAYIPIQALANGEHELVLAAPAHDDAAQSEKAESWRIPFWR